SAFVVEGAGCAASPASTVSSPPCPVTPGAPSAAPDAVVGQFPEDQAAIAKAIDQIVDAAKKKDIDRLESMHAYGPKFSKFEDDGTDRMDAANGKKGERDGFAALTAFDAHVENLKVDVFGPAAVATFVMKYDATMG